MGAFDKNSKSKGDEVLEESEKKVAGKSKKVKLFSDNKYLTATYPPTNKTAQFRDGVCEIELSVEELKYFSSLQGVSSKETPEE